MIKHSNKGITLIVLIITVVILLIIAGVAISALTGEDNLMAKAQFASQKSKATSLEEAIKVAYFNVAMDKKENIAVQDIIDNLRNSNTITDEKYSISVADSNNGVIEDKNSKILIDILIINNEIKTNVVIGKKSEEAPKPTVEYILTPTEGQYAENVQIGLTASENITGIKNILMPDLSIQNFNGQKVVNTTYSVNKNGLYFFEVTGVNERKTVKAVEVKNSVNAQDITISAIPTTLINSSVKVNIVYSENVIVNGKNLENSDKYQYKIGASGEWQNANIIQTVDLTSDTTIYARYYTGALGLKEMNINVVKNMVKIGDYVEYSAGPAGEKYSSWRILTNTATDNVNIISATNIKNMTFVGTGSWSGLETTLEGFAANYRNNTVEISSRYPDKADYDSYIKGSTVAATGATYWIKAKTYEYRSGVYFHQINFITATGDYASCIVYRTDDGNVSETKGLRPIIKLKPNLKVVGGKGTQSEPWKISE